MLQSGRSAMGRSHVQRNHIEYAVLMSVIWCNNNHLPFGKCRVYTYNIWRICSE